MRPICLLATAAVLSACGNETVGDPLVIVRDSAGVQIVELGPLDERIALRVGDPAYRVGWSAADHQFGRIISGALLADGRAAVGDIGSEGLVLLDRYGDVEAVMGGPGEGPTEIGQLLSVSVLPGDTLLVEDDGNARFTRFYEGARVGSQPMVGGSPYFLRVIGVDRGSLILTTSAYQPYFEQPWLPFYVVRHTPGTERWDTVHAYGAVPRIVEGETSNPFRAYGSAAVTAGTVVTIRGDRPQVEVVGLEGGVIRIVRWAEEPVQPTEAHWAEYVEYLRGSAASTPPDELTRRLADARAAIDGPMPYVGQLFGDSEGRAWVSTYSVDYRHPTRFRLFDTSGAWLGWVNLPPRTEILAIGEDAILAVQRNDLDVDAVVMLPLR